MGSLGIDDAVAAARGGDDAAFERLVRETYAGVFTLAARITEPRRRGRCCPGSVYQGLPRVSRLPRRITLHDMVAPNHR